MDTILNQIENDLPALHIAIYVLSFLLALVLIGIFAAFSKPNCINRNEDIHMGITFLALLGALAAGVEVWARWISTDSDMAAVAEQEICHNTLAVHHKAVFDKYIDYTITAGRFNRIYARIQKFPELDKNVYAVQLDGTIGIINDAHAQAVIDEAVTRYELYRK